IALDRGALTWIDAAVLRKGGLHLKQPEARSLVVAFCASCYALRATVSVRIQGTFTDRVGDNSQSVRRTVAPVKSRMAIVFGDLFLCRLRANRSRGVVRPIGITAFGLRRWLVARQSSQR